jgi:outer membrane protein insertion porin family
LLSQPAFAALNNEGRISSLRATVSYDTRDNRLFPSDGMFHSVSAEASSDLLGATSNRVFQRYNLFARFYKPIAFGFVFKTAIRFGLLQSASDTQIPPSELYLLGGINSIRGYNPFSIGPYRRATHNDRGTGLYDPFSDTYAFVEGGNKEALGNFELEFPIFEEVGIRGVIFIDAGNAYAQDENFFYIAGKHRPPQTALPTDNSSFDPSTLPLGLFWSVGFGFRWFSPIGPLRFEWGIPLTPRPADPHGPLFEFSIGNAF